jgi:hypothetical protein
MEEQIRHVRNQRPAYSDLLKKYEYQYQQHLQRELEDEEYERQTGKSLKKREDTRDHWHCPFFKYCWDSGMSRLPATKDCPECGSRKRDIEGVSIFRHLGPVPSQKNRFNHHKEGWTLKKKKRISITVRAGALIDLTIPRNASLWLRSLEEAEARHLETLRKARPDLADKVHYTHKKESRPPRKEWWPRSTRDDPKTSADAHMVFVLPAEFHARGREGLSVAQLDLGPRPVIFEKPQAKNYKHLKALYLKGYINGQPINKMLVDKRATVNILPYSVLHHLGRSAGDLIKTNVTLSDFNGQTSEAQGVLSVDLTIENKTVLTSFFIVNSKSTYIVLLGRDWIHANCCIPSTMHQYLIQWDGDEVEVVHADDSIEISHAAMSIRDAECDTQVISMVTL